MSARGRAVVTTLMRHAARAFLATRGFTVSGPNRRASVAREMRLAFEELGPAFIKLGQLISVRPDLFSPETVFEMEELRDSVRPVEFDLVRAVVERTLGAPVERLFASFDREPLGSASIAQVHRAVLRESYRPVVGEVVPAGAELAVKVVRPGASETIAADIAVLEPMARRLHRFGALRRFDLPGLLSELADSLVSECDLRNEGRISDRFAHDFRDDPLVYTPRIVWPLSGSDVLTMTLEHGWHLSDAREAEAAGVDARMLALHGAEVFMRQVLELGRFHADLHQSNLLITPDSRICYLDFGIVGVVEEDRREAVAQVLAATVYGDADRALKYSAQLGLVVPPDRRQGVRDEVALLMGSTLTSASPDIKAFALGFLGIMNRRKVAVPRGFGLLVKALVTVEGCARMIYPDIDIMQAAKPYATRLVARTMLDPKRIWSRLPAAIDAAMSELVG